MLSIIFTSWQYSISGNRLTYATVCINKGYIHHAACNGYLVLLVPVLNNSLVPLMVDNISLVFKFM